MSKFLLSILCLLVLAATAMAQSDKRVEFFAGYSNLQAEGINDPNDPTDPSGNFFERRSGLHGFEVAATGFLNKGFGITGDFSFHQDEDSDTNGSTTAKASFRTMYFMGGPSLKLRNASRLEPFVHALVGGAHNRIEFRTTTPVTGGTQTVSFDSGKTDFAMALGGGLDIRLGDKFSLRAFKVEWAPIFLSDRSINVLSSAGAITPFRLEGQRQDNLRLSVGLVF